jgi:hypothetical protein
LNDIGEQIVGDGRQSPDLAHRSPRPCFWAQKKFGSTVLAIALQQQNKQHPQVWALAEVG